MVTQSSLSGLVCSCQNPTACPSSWTTIPNLSQFLPIEMAWGPLPRLPTKEQQLQKNSNITFMGVAKLQNCKESKSLERKLTNWTNWADMSAVVCLCQLMWRARRLKRISNWRSKQLSEFTKTKGSRQKIKRDFKTNWNFDETEPRVTLNWKNWRPAKSTSKINP